MNLKAESFVSVSKKSESSCTTTKNQVFEAKRKLPLKLGDIRSKYLSVYNILLYQCVYVIVFLCLFYLNLFSLWIQRQQLYK